MSEHQQETLDEKLKKMLPFQRTPPPPPKNNVDEIIRDIILSIIL